MEINSIFEIGCKIAIGGVWISIILALLFFWHWFWEKVTNRWFVREISASAALEVFGTISCTIISIGLIIAFIGLLVGEG
ncbi:MAG: hypothetical protein GY853_01635 [PVC group bacterium]|nr:hypothetical protein [PVC group bacterium]